MRTSVNKTTKEYWEDLLPHRKQTLIEDFDLFEKLIKIQQNYLDIICFHLIKVRSDHILKNLNF